MKHTYNWNHDTRDGLAFYEIGDNAWSAGAEWVNEDGHPERFHNDTILDALALIEEISYGTLDLDDPETNDHLWTAVDIICEYTGRTAESFKPERY